MFNHIGRLLVLVQTAASLVLGAWAAGTYLQMNDFGWKEPLKVWESKEAGRRVPSELDKRIAGLQELYRVRDRSEKAIQPALDALAETMDRFPKNHRFYLGELEALRNAGGAIQPKELQYKGGTLVLDTPGKAVGKPAMAKALPGIDKSLKVYQDELKKVQGDIDKLTPELEELVRKTDEVTVHLFGTKDDQGNTADIGLAEILENEKKLQDKIAAEKEELTPVYVDAQRRMEAFQDRYRTMQRYLQVSGKK